MSDDVTFLSQLVRDSMELQALEALPRAEDREDDAMKSLQVRVTDMVQSGRGNALKPANEQTLSLKRPDVSQVPAISEENQSSDETLTQQPEVSESDDGVKYCLLDTSIGSSSKAEDVEMLNMSNGSISFTSKSDGS